MAMEINFEHVGYTYQPGTPFESRALYDINIEIPNERYVAIVGHTGSGKSTLLQHLNALIKPTEGIVKLGERQITSESTNKDLKPLRKKVGIVFQFPEAQLFEETVVKDVAFGPKNFGVSEEDALVVAKDALELVGLGEEYLERSPFDLSGGQMRRVAIAGVLAMEPEVLVLDEPTAGLDPKGRLDMMEMFYDLHKDKGITIILVTHLMDDVANYADHVIVLEKGEVVNQGTPREIFKETAWLEKRHLGLPSAMSFAEKLADKGFDFDTLPLNTEELTKIIVDKIGGTSLEE